MGKVIIFFTLYLVSEILFGCCIASAAMPEQQLQYPKPIQAMPCWKDGEGKEWGGDWEHRSSEFGTVRPAKFDWQKDTVKWVTDRCVPWLGRGCQWEWCCQYLVLLPGLPGLHLSFQIHLNLCQQNHWCRYGNTNLGSGNLSLRQGNKYSLNQRRPMGLPSHRMQHVLW